MFGYYVCIVSAIEVLSVRARVSLLGERGCSKYVYTAAEFYSNGTGAGYLAGNFM